LTDTDLVENLHRHLVTGELEAACREKGRRRQNLQRP